MNMFENQCRSSNRCKKRWFAIAAILVGFSPLLLSEAVLRITGAGQLSDANDPYIGFVGREPLFEKNPQSGRFEIARSRQTFFRPDSFDIRKGPAEYRVFCLGGSTVQGRPYAIETAFSTWLELSLQACQPDRAWKVVNCGGVSYASYRLAPIMQELLAYQPDLFILYTGHNEFLEDRTYAHVKQTPRALAIVHRWLTHLRTYNALRSAWMHVRPQGTRSPAGQKSRLPTEVDARLDYRGGLDDYHRDDAWRDAIVEHFEFNLRRMIAMAHHAGIPVILVNPVSNLKDCPPFKFANRDGISTHDKSEFDALWEQARQEGRPVTDKIAILNQILDIDRRHAGVLYHLGKCYQNSQQWETARRWFLRAKDEDICPLRILSSMADAIRRVAVETSTPLIDAQQMFDQLTREGIAGNEWLVDHVHPSIRGHQRLAAALLEVMTRDGRVTPLDGWETRRDALYHAQFESLDALYYIRGQQRLEGLRSWAAGQSSRVRPNQPGPVAN